MQAHPADECRAHALHCVEVAQHAPTLDDRSDFLVFAETWYRLANEIDIAIVSSRSSMAGQPEGDGKYRGGGN